ncbi:hypothetical protein MKX03_028026 [Papaver bracteatum]|nr:hypothetical protein MKX03_028026 [Papaver bracteatum]
MADLSIFFKDVVLLLVLFGIFQMIRELAFQSGNSVGSSKIEGRIAEVEKLLDKTIKMVQVQVENEISGLGREITKKVEEKYETELKKLEEIVEKEIEKHAADGLGMVDYALASGGGMVLDHSEPFMAVKGSGWLPFKNEYGVHQDAQRVLEPSFGEPGKCFPFQGRYAYVVIKLRTAIIPEAVTVEHVAKSVAYDRSTAPKDCRVSGWYQITEAIADGSGADLSRQYEKMFMLSEFVYDLDRSNVQTFKVDSGEKRIVNTVRFDFNSNHGAANMCIYRLRVHGHEPDSVAISESEL